MKDKNITSIKCIRKQSGIPKNLSTDSESWSISGVMVQGRQRGWRTSRGVGGRVVRNKVIEVRGVQGWGIGLAFILSEMESSGEF